MPVIFSVQFFIRSPLQFLRFKIPRVFFREPGLGFGQFRSVSTNLSWEYCTVHYFEMLDVPIYFESILSWEVTFLPIIVLILCQCIVLLKFYGLA